MLELQLRKLVSVDHALMRVVADGVVMTKDWGNLDAPFPCDLLGKYTYYYMGFNDL